MAGDRDRGSDADDRRTLSEGFAGDGDSREGARAARGMTAAGVDRERGVFMISVAAELAGMHPQTLRIYESRGLITPKRSAKNTRLYSQADVDRLGRIQELTSELGMNLAGVERVLEMEREMERMRARMRTLERQAARLERELEEGIDRVRRSYKRELVPYEEPGRALVPSRGGDRTVRLRVTRPAHHGR
ncbi:MAG TPA: MerR family transcriptional regulator [Thermoleophilaceae bacterium]|nr:MerR family transcriptional regulator [Thermoleophilaceae bacterium]